MFTIGQVIFCGIVGWVFGLFGALFCFALVSVNKIEENSSSKDYEKILTANNILLKISLLKMIIGFAPKDEIGCYYTGVNGFVSDAFCRLDIESHTVNEQMLLDKIEILDKSLGEL